MSKSQNIKKAVKNFFFIDKWKEYKNYTPSKKQWVSFLKIISLPERILFLIFLITFFSSAFLWWRQNYISITKLIPKEGGTIKELIIGEPQNLNPLFTMLNDADKDVTELIYSGLLKYTPEGKLKEDLVKSYKVEGKNYIFVLKDDIFWDDGEKITADDVIFTMELIQNPEIQSPLRIIFHGTTFKKADEKTIIFTVENPSPSFIENFTFKILPKHIFQEVKPTELSNFLPKKFASSGPFKIAKIIKSEEKIKKIILSKNENYYSPAYINSIELIFVKNEEEILTLKNKLTNIANIPFDKIDEFKKFEIKELYTPRYFALFLNQKNQILKEKEIRKALLLATPKEKIIKDVFKQKARKVDSPLLEENQVKKVEKSSNFNLQKAKEILEKNGWQDKNKDGILEKEIDGKNYSLNFTLYTAEQKELKKVCEIIKENWGKIGVKIEVKTYPPQELLQNIIKERKYEILLFGHSLTMTPEPYFFWHSSQIKYPGLNLSLYENKDLDKLLEKASKEININERKKILEKIQNKIIEDIPAIFLYSPNYLYGVKKQLKGFNGKFILDPSKRFIGIEDWYIKEKRISKDKSFQKKLPKIIEIKNQTKNSPKSTPTINSPQK